jgi:hypothetical protein
MLLELVTSTAMSGVLIYTYLDKGGTTEAAKIQRVAAHCGLAVRENGKTHTIHLLRRTRHKWGTEYVYRIPLGLSFEDIRQKKQHIEDGLNHRRRLFDVTLDDLRALRINGDILQQLRQLLTGSKQRKEVLMDYDGALRIRVYKEPLPQLVPFDDKTLTSCKGWSVCIGQSREHMVIHDFERMPHLIVAGTTRYGKSNFLKSLITTLIHNQPASRVHLLDLKGGLAFQRFKNARQVSDVAKDVDESLEMLRKIEQEMKKRQKEFLDKGFEDIREAKYTVRDFIVVDEAAELAPSGENDKDTKKKKTECEKILSEIARIGGGLGYRLVYATQYPTGDILPRQIKQNATAKLCFLLDTHVASMVVLDEPGAESLPLIPGRGIYRTDRKTIVQAPYIENKFIDKTIRPHITIKAKEEVKREHRPATQGGEYSLVIEET